MAGRRVVLKGIKSTENGGLQYFDFNENVEIGNLDKKVLIQAKKVLDSGFQIC